MKKVLLIWTVLVCLVFIGVLLASLQNHAFAACDSDTSLQHPSNDLKSYAVLIPVR